MPNLHVIFQAPIRFFFFLLILIKKKKSFGIFFLVYIIYNKMSLQKMMKIALAP